MSEGAQTGNARAPLRRIAVVGGGPVALAAATGFAAAVPTAAVHLIPAALTADALADRWPLVLPPAQAMLARLGLPAAELLARGGVRPRLASRFARWSRDGAPWLVADDTAAPAAPVALHHLWLRAAASGRPVPPFHALVPACAAALAGTPLREAEPALDCDPAALGRMLGAIAGRRRVALAAPLAGVEPGARGIAALHLADGSRHAADLFVDASGPARHLAGHAGFAAWDDLLPCDRMTVADSADPGTPLIDEIAATPTGWRAAWPGTTVHGFAAATGAPEVAGGAVAIAPGRLAQPWSGNVLALGDAAVQAGPLGRAGFTLALGQLALALELLPGPDDAPLLRAEYNRRAGERADRLRDYLALPYCAAPRGGKGPAGPFWRRAAPPLPASLATALAQFARRGDVPAADEETVPRDAWAAVLLGLGLRPERANPIALSLPPAAALEAVAARTGAHPLARSRPAA